MKELFLKLIGISGEMTSGLHDAGVTLDLRWHRPGLLWVGLALLVPIAVGIVLRHRASLPHVPAWQRNVLSTARWLVLLLLVLVLAGPYLRLEEPVTHKPIVAVIVDESASMALPSGPFEPNELKALATAVGGDVDDAELRRKLPTMPRRDLLDMALTAAHSKVFEPLAEQFELRTYRVARDVRQSALKAAEPLADADRQGSALGAALERALSDAAGRSVAGIVVFSDGRWTSGPEPMAVLRRWGTSHDDSAVPVWSVPVGAARPIEDVSIMEVVAPQRVSEGDTAAIIASLQSFGFDGRKVAVTLVDASDAGAVLDRREVVLQAGERQRVQLAYKAGEASGAATRLQLRVDEQPEEQHKANNVRDVLIEVDAQKLRVLYLEGTPRWDFRFLDHALRLDHGLETSIVTEAQLESMDPAPEDFAAAARLPQDAAGWQEYALVILGDVSPKLLPERYQEQLVRAVEEDGVGVIVQAGPRAMPHRFAEMPLARLLPMQVESSTQAGPSPAAGPLTITMATGGVEAMAYAPFQLAVTAPGAIHPAFELYESASRNRELWSRMPAFYWAAAPGQLRPGATVLAEFDAGESGRRRPLIVEHFAGRGRVLFIGIDSTFLWRRNIGDHLFYRFWGQAIRHAAHSVHRSGDKSWLDVYPARIEPGGAAAVELFALDQDANPVDADYVDVQVTLGDRAQPLRLQRAGAAGMFRGVWSPQPGDRPGAYRFTYAVPDADKPLTASVLVAVPDDEALDATVNRDLLGSLGDATGGGLLELHQLADLPGKLHGQPVHFVRSREETLWDNWLTLVLLVGLYCTDVGMRRVLGLT